MFYRALVASLTLAMAACDGNPSARELAADDYGHPIVAGAEPKRIVSLNPTTTEILAALGAETRLVGRTSWDLHPQSIRSVRDVGSGIRPNVEAVLATRPDLVVLYASTDNRAAADALRNTRVATLSLKVDRIEDFHRAVRTLGEVLGVRAKAAAVSDSVRRTLALVENATGSLSRPKVFWHVWDAPLITVAAGSYMDELLLVAGAQNVYADLRSASPGVNLEDVIRRDPDVVLATPDGAAAIRRNRRWQAVRAVRTGNLREVDTTLVGRPGPRMGEAAISLARLLHPGISL